MEKCAKEGEINTITEAIFGNGKYNGILAELKEIKDDIKKFIKFQIQYETREGERRKYKLDLENIEIRYRDDAKHSDSKMRWLIGIIVLTSVTTMGLMATILIAIFSDKVSL